MRSFLVLSLFISASALACPNLAGNYTRCTSQPANESQLRLIITQNIVDGVMLYTNTSIENDTNETTIETYKADGKTITATETDPETGDNIKLSTTVSCSNNALKIKMNVLFNESVASDLLTTVSKTGEVLSIVTKGTSMGETINEVLICNN